MAQSAGRRRRGRLNGELIVSQLRQVSEELAKIERDILEGKLEEENLRFRFQHAYHHLNFAWNARRASESESGELTDAAFNRWSKMPRDIPPLSVR